MSDWSAGQPPGGRRPQGQGGYDYYRGAKPPPRRDAPPPPGPGGSRSAPPGGRPPHPPRRKKRWGRRIAAVLGVLVLLIAGLVIYADSSLQRTSALEFQEKGKDTPGTNWLLVGSDSREGMTDDQRDELSAGDEIGGKRTDTMMLVHIPEGGGQPSLISFPRDSSVPVEGLGRTKLNAAFAEGGPTLLAQTIETTSGVHIDRYAEIGLGGFAGLVDSVGGIEMCLEQPMNDWRAGVQLEAGCQQLDGAQALGFSRARYSLEGGDLERAENQRKVLGKIVDKATSPTTLLNPFRLVPMISKAGKTFLVNDGDHVWHLGFLALAMGKISGGDGVTTQVPFGGFGTDDSGQSVVEWDKERALQMFDAIAQDKPIPPETMDN